MTGVDPNGQPFGRYYLQKKLATGGMGELYLAKATGAAGFEKRLVIKKILSHLAKNEAFVKRFIDEAKIVVQLNHGNIVSVIDMGVVDGEYFIAMEYVDGRDLRDLLKYCAIKGKRIPWELTLHLLAEVLKGLAYAHNKADEQGRSLQIIHRDVSPSNILISREGEVKLSDFGIAKATEKSSESISGMLQGKFLYMSPEQAAGGAIDQRSDLFSIGTIAYEMLTGERPFNAQADLEILSKVRTLDPPPPSSLRDDLPPEIDQFVARALAKDPATRFQSAEEFQHALTRYLYEKHAGVTPAKIAEFFDVPLRENLHPQLTLDDLIHMGLAESPVHIPAGQTLTAGFPIGRNKPRTPTRTAPEEAAESGDRAPRNGRSVELAPDHEVSPLAEASQTTSNSLTPVGATSSALTPSVYTPSDPLPAASHATPRLHLGLTLGLLGIIAILLAINVWAQLRESSIRFPEMEIDFPTLIAPTPPLNPGNPGSQAASKPVKVVAPKPTPRPLPTKVVKTVKKTAPRTRVMQLKKVSRDARLFVDDKPLPRRDDDAYRIPMGRPVRVRVESPGGRSWTKVIDPDDGKPVTLSPPAPRPRTRWIALTVQPPDATISGATGKQGNETRVRLIEGQSKRIVIEREGFIAQTLMLRYGDPRRSIRIRLVPKTKGTVRFYLFPVDATASVNGQQVSGGGLRQLSLPTGRHTIVFAYKSQRLKRTVTIKANQSVPLATVDFLKMKSETPRPRK
ncbi:MAG: protein kinase [Myxococcales bacterium]|nr:protein kinase [Myxococcales bacterium]